MLAFLSKHIVAVLFTLFTSVVVGGVVTKNTEFTRTTQFQNQPSVEKSRQVLSEMQAFDKTPTPTPYSQPSPRAYQQVQNTQVAITHDGSRTGPIVDYREYCTNKTIKVYENEILTKVSTIDGKKYDMTQGDWDCYYKNSQSNPSTSGVSNPSSGNTPSKVPVFLSSFGYVLYCPPQNVGAVQSINSTIESKKSQWQSDYNNCISNFQNTNSCYTTCKNSESNELSSCPNPANPSVSVSEYEVCNNQATNDYGNCIAKCPASDQTQACSVVSAEQNDLDSQIENLCN